MISYSEYKMQVQAEKRAKPFSLLRLGYLIHRDVSAPVSYVLVRWFPWVSANQISFFMIMVGLVGSTMAYREDSPLLVFGGVALVYMSFLLDKVDGEVARFRNQQSLRGVYLDELYHALVPAAFITAYFTSRIDTDSSWMTMMLVVVVFLGLFRRYERKWYIIIKHKKRILIEQGSIAKNPPVAWIHKVGNSLVFRSVAVVERFDILLLACLGIEILALKSYELTEYFFLAYAGVSVLYSVRFVVLNYFGSLDRQVESLQK